MLIDCKECHRSIASNALTCPGCGAPTAFRKRTIGMFLLGLLLVLIGRALTGSWLF